MVSPPVLQRLRWAPSLAPAGSWGKKGSEESGGQSRAGVGVLEVWGRAFCPLRCRTKPPLVPGVPAPFPTLRPSRALCPYPGCARLPTGMLSAVCGGAQPLPRAPVPPCPVLPAPPVPSSSRYPRMLPAPPFPVPPGPPCPDALGTRRSRYPRARCSRFFCNQVLPVPPFPVVPGLPCPVLPLPRARRSGSPRAQVPPWGVPRARPVPGTVRPPPRSSSPLLSAPSRPSSPGKAKARRAEAERCPPGRAAPHRGRTGTAPGPLRARGHHGFHRQLLPTEPAALRPQR